MAEQAWHCLFIQPLPKWHLDYLSNSLFFYSQMWCHLWGYKEAKLWSHKQVFMLYSCWIKTAWQVTVTWHWDSVCILCQVGFLIHGLTWLGGTIKIFLQERHRVDHSRVPGRVHKFCSWEISRGTAEDEQAGREVKISRIFEKKENKAKDKTCCCQFQRGWRTPWKYTILKE